MNDDDRHAVQTRWRDSLTQAAAHAYEAAHGNPIPDQQVGSRWRLEPPIAAAVAVAVVLVAVVAAWAWRPAPEVELAPLSPGPAAEMADLVVHVAGQVREPGVLSLPADARVADAIAAAGGTTGEADDAAVNMARPLVDGEQIYVPHRDEPDGDGPVNLNRADAGELEDLPGIGPVLAERIVADRDAHGPFTALADLARVSGIGTSVIEQLDSVATV